VFDNRERWVPPPCIDVGRMTEDPSDEIRSPGEEPRTPGDEPTIHHRNTRQPIFTPGRRIGGPDRIPNEPRLNLFPPNEAGRMRVAASTQSPQSLNPQQLAQAQQVLRDLRAQNEATLDEYEEWEAEYNHRRDTEAENLRNLRHLPGPETVETPPAALEQVRTPRYSTLEPPTTARDTSLSRRRSARLTGEQGSSVDVIPNRLNQRQLRELRRLADFNRVAVETVQDDDDFSYEYEDERESVYAVGLFSDIGEPTTVKQALKRPDADKWKESIRAEINNFQKRNAWKLVPMSQLRKKGESRSLRKPYLKSRTNKMDRNDTRHALSQKVSWQSQEWITLSPARQWLQTVV
jgi:hypothetical protein